jgi:hypothetical protein
MICATCSSPRPAGTQRHVWSGVILRVQGTATLPLGVGYLGLGRLTARFSETSTKPFASNIKANLTLVTFAKYSFI